MQPGGRTSRATAKFKSQNQYEVDGGQLFVTAQREAIEEIKVTAPSLIGQCHLLDPQVLPFNVQNTSPCLKGVIVQALLEPERVGQVCCHPRHTCMCSHRYTLHHCPRHEDDSLSSSDAAALGMYQLHLVAHGAL